MAKKKLLAVKFGAANKKNFVGKVGHTRTGACTAKGRCFHGRIKK
jgi:hypothetical protein